MTLVDCRECSGRVARSAKACPHCGAPDPKEATWGDLGVGVLSVVFVLLAVVFAPLLIVAAFALQALVVSAVVVAALFAVAVAIAVL